MELKHLKKNLSGETESGRMKHFDNIVKWQKYENYTFIHALSCIYKPLLNMTLLQKALGKQITVFK